MIEVRRFRASDFGLLRQLRLAALADAPDAFCARHDVEAAMPEQAWRQRAASNAEGIRTAGFCGLLDGEPRGMVVGVRDDERPDEVELNALWVAPGARGRGLARALVDAVSGWAVELGCARVALGVTETSAAAIALYEAAGFVRTGVTEPYAADPEVAVIRMHQILAS